MLHGFQHSYCTQYVFCAKLRIRYCTVYTVKCTAYIAQSNMIRQCSTVQYVVRVIVPVVRTYRFKNLFSDSLVTACITICINCIRRSPLCGEGYHVQNSECIVRRKLIKNNQLIIIKLKLYRVDTE